MESKLAKLEQDTLTNSLEIVHHKVRLLMEVWKVFFDEICYLDYLTSLPSSIEQFLGEIYCLTMNFCVRKTQQIRELQNKVYELKRVLGIRDGVIDGWGHGNMSLDRKVAQLQQQINSLQQQADERKRLMEEYTLEEVQLLKELGEAAPPHEPLCANAETGFLPDAQKMAQFADYLSRLRTEKVKRIVTRDELQSDIRKKAEQLDWVPRKDRHRQLINEQTLIPSLSNLHELQHLDFVLSGLLKRKQQQQQEQQTDTAKQQSKKAKKPEKRKKQPRPEEPIVPIPTSTDPDRAKQGEEEQEQEGQNKVQEKWTEARKKVVSPPPVPPSSPVSEVDISVSTPTNGLFEMTIEAYMRVEKKAGRPADREKIIEEMFRRFRASINVWWERCLILPNERQQCKVLYTDQLDEEAFVAHIEQQKLLQSYYHENEAIFRLIYQWAELWNRALQLQDKQKQSVGAESKVLAEVSEQLATIRKQLEGKCREFEQRCQVKFTMYGMPVMQVLQRCQDKREKLKLANSCKVQPAPVLRTKATSARQQLSPEMVLELNLMLRDLLIEKQTEEEEPAEKQSETDTDDSNRGSDDDGNSSTSSSNSSSASSNTSSDDGGEVDHKRDDELLEEAFASATAAVTTKNRIHSVNGHPTSS
ncbi:uncharacterized protein LOC118504851 [Anopheles stephensi]|uniref:uncharacterized protein LOC118504851 n=1 Tax=Anopheles stephensi TaxID=30069 RepID=UPI001658BB7A|nr:uncharacterized protein LOC118504851 [Anopheles stephensi]